MHTVKPFALRTLFAAGLFCALPLALAGCVESPEGLDEGEEVTDGERPLDDANIDMANYVVPSCAGAGAAWQIESEQFRVVPMGMQDGRGRFVIVKGTSGDGYEEWSVDSDWLRIRSDTTWAWEESPGGAWCDVKCGDNVPGTCQQRWNTDPNNPRNGLSPSSPWAYTLYHEPGDPSVGAAWIQRKMTLPVGGAYEFTTQMEIKGADRATCAGCYVNFSTAPGQAAGRTVVARRYASWHGFSDVVHLSVQSGPGAGEQYFYARGEGWIGFNDRVASQKVDSNAFPQSPCAGFSQGSICEAMGGSPPAPQPSGGCACRGDVNNFCLYPANTSGCGMTAAYGYCDPNGDGNFGDADWERGYNEYQGACAGSPPPPPPAACECKGGVNNFCLYPASTAGCAMTEPGGYCDPNGDGNFGDADWGRGYNEYFSSCN